MDQITEQRANDTVQRWSACLLLAVSLALVHAPLSMADSTQPVQCQDSAVTVAATQQVTFPASCTDPDPHPDQTLYYYLRDYPTAGTAAAGDSPGTWRYQNSSGVPGTDRFTYLVVKSRPGPQGPQFFYSNTATVTITVTDPPPPPPPAPAVDTDGDGIPDSFDRCRTIAATVPDGWVVNSTHGCPAGVPAPFASTVAAPRLRSAIRRFLARWRRPAFRAAAEAHHHADIRFDVPKRSAGAGRVRVGVSVAPDVNLPRRSSIYGVRWCTPGRRCTLRVKVVPAGVRAYAHRQLEMQAEFAVRAPGLGKYGRLWTETVRHNVHMPR